VFGEPYGGTPEEQATIEKMKAWRGENLSFAEIAAKLTYNGVVDMGAYELYGSNQVVNLPLLHLEPSGQNLLLSFTAYPPSIYQLQSSTNLLQWQDLETNGPFASPTTITRTISPQGALRQFYRVWSQ
jgi:hypothetical protein